MPVRQPFRGDAEDKRYVVYGNFGGGINTSTPDSELRDFEFRDLTNVELSEQGYVKNRRGFACFSIFNQLLVDNNIEWLKTTTVDEPLDIRVLTDVDNIFDKMADYATFSALVAAQENFSDVSLLILSKFTQTIDAVDYYSLILNKYVIAYDGTVTRYNLYSDTITSPLTVNMTGIQVVEFDNNTYYNLSKLNAGLAGMLKYDGETGTASVISASTCYAPNSYEITNVGFNLIATEPLSIAYESSGVAEIRGIYITKVGDDTMVYDQIPTAGAFVMNVIYKGAEADAAKLVPYFYVEDAFGKRTELTNVVTASDVDLTDGIGLLKYTIQLSTDSTANNSLIFMTVRKIDASAEDYAHSFDTVDDMVTFFTDRELRIAKAATNKYKVYVEDGISIYGHVVGSTIADDNVIMTMAGGDAPTAATSLGLLRIVRFFNASTHYETEAINTVYPELINTNAVVIGAYYGNDDTFAEESFLGYKILPVDFNSTVGVIANFTEAVNLVDYGWDNTYAANFLTESISTLSPSMLSIYRVQSGRRVYEGGEYPVYEFATFADFPASGSYAGNYHALDTDKWYVFNSPDYEEIEYEFYKYNGGYEGDATDFDEVALEDLIDVTLSFTTYYAPGNKAPIKVEAFDLTNANITLVGNHMVLYRDNVLLFSDAYKFDYFPNYNYITLALDTGDVIQKIAYFRGSYIIFTRERVYRISGTFGGTDFKIVMVNDSIGCIAPDSVRGINNTLQFLSFDGLYVLKQNYYMEQLENVEKVDKNIKGLIPYGTNYETFLYNEQYCLIVKDAAGAYVKTVKQYYNSPFAALSFPYVVETYRVAPERLFKVGAHIYALYDDILYVYDSGYLDFPPEDVAEEDIDDYTYYCRIITGRLDMGYPTHDKKFKSVFIKTYYSGSSVLFVNVLVDDFLVVDPHVFKVVKNNLGTLDYIEYTDPTVNGTESISLVVGSLGNFVLGDTPLGDNPYTINKIEVGSKGKAIQLMIEHKSNANFGVVNIGYLHKLGKVKESA